MTNREFIRDYMINSKGLACITNTFIQWPENIPWINWFNRNYCMKCEPIKGYCKDIGKEAQVCPCETESVCKLFGNVEAPITDEAILDVWLDKEYEREDWKVE